MDYDDAFVAYLNGVEVARGKCGQPGEVLMWNQVLDNWHEAVLYAGGTPDLVELDMESVLVQGLNLLGHRSPQRERDILRFDGSSVSVFGGVDCGIDV